jgi:hypothetical protein
VAVQLNGDVSPLEVYWHSVLPNSSMPRAIHNLIYPSGLSLSLFPLDIIKKHSYHTNQNATNENTMTSGKKTKNTSQLFRRLIKFMLINHR